MHANEPALPPTGVCTCYKVRTLARQLTGLYDAELERHGLTITQYAALMTLMRASSALSVAELARRLQMDRTTTSRLVGPLEKEGLVARAEPGVAGNDSRARPLQVTARGRKRVLAAVPSWRAAQQRVEALLGAPLQTALERAADAARRALVDSDSSRPEVA